MRALNHRYLTDPSLAHRAGTTRLRITGPDGAPLARTEVEVAQRRHDVEFACISPGFVGAVESTATELPGQASNSARDARPAGAGPDPELAQQWLGLFDTATLPFYWGSFEVEEGAPRTAGLRAMAQWCRDNGVRTKGHPLVWHTVQPGWLKRYPNEEVERLLRARVRREVSDFAGLVDTWDAINEAVIMPVFDKDDNAVTRLARDKGRLHMIRLAFEEARAANPNVRLLLNDFDMSTAYECLIEAVLEAGIEVDVLGLQSHMHQGWWGEEKIERVLDRFARYGLPMHFTEITLLSGELMPAEIVDLNDHQVAEWPSTPEGEARQADELVRHYRALLAHPQVESITYWGIEDGGWLNAPGGLVRLDGSPKPAYDALRELVRGEWWLSPTTMQTDDDGAVEVSGWFGDYDVRRPGGDAASFRVDPG
ncbi:MAG: endo-1,4-beta-xylanase, partial [Actinomycetota bacterium]|nr:endo-1,4-beta-xylanase [Actinomycetota bacterium]